MPHVPPRPVQLPPPVRVDPVLGTPYGLAILGTPPITTGLASGSLVAGIASILVGFVVGCFALVGASGGWGATAAGAFAVLAGVLGIGAVVLGGLGLRQIRRSSALRGKGLALAGMICGAVGVVLTVIAMVAAFVLDASQISGV